LGEVAAAEEQGALNALGMDSSSCGFDRARSRPAKIIKGAKKAAYYPEMRHSPWSLAQRLAPSPLFLPVASSSLEVFTVAHLDKAGAACAAADAARLDDGFCYTAQRLSLNGLLPPAHKRISFCAGTAPTPLG
jgi:hypothetical protein